MTRFDRIMANRFGGKMLGILVLLVGMTVSMVAGLPMMAIGFSIPALARGLTTQLGSNTFHEVVNAVVAITGTAVSFASMVAGLTFGFRFIFGLLDSSNRLSRINNAFAPLMAHLGLPGTGVASLAASLGCAVSGAAQTAFIQDPKMRRRGIIACWLIPCSCVWMNIGVLCFVFYGIWGAVAMLGLLVLSYPVLLLTQRIFVGKNNTSMLAVIVDLKPVQKPNYRAVLAQSLQEAKTRFLQALPLLIIISALVWLIASSGSDFVTSLAYSIFKNGDAVTRIFGLRFEFAASLLLSIFGRQGYLAVLSCFMQPGTVEVPFWPLLTMQSNSDTAGLYDLLQTSVTLSESLAFLCAFYFIFPCFSAITAVRSVDGSRTWTLKLTLYFIALAFILSTVVYHVTNMIMNLL